MNNEFCHENEIIPFINISRTNSFSDSSKNIFYIQNLKYYFENNNFFISNLRNKSQKSHSASCLRKNGAISLNYKFITTGNNLQLKQPKIPFKNGINKTITIIEDNSSFSENNKDNSQKKNKITISYCKNEDEFANTSYSKNINKFTENSYISPKKNFVSKYNDINVNKLKNKSKEFISIQNYPGKNLMNIFDKIKVNKDKEKSNNKDSNNNNKKLHNNIASLRTVFDFDKKELYQKNEKKSKIVNYNIISSKKDKINNNVKTVKYNFTSLKKNIIRENLNNNKFKYHKLNKFKLNNKYILSKNSQKNNTKRKKSKSFDFTRIKKLKEIYFK